MKNLSILFVLVLFLGLNIANAQDETKTEKKETGKMEMNHEKMDHSKMDHSKMDHSKMNDEMSEDKVVAKPWNAVCPVRGEEVNQDVATVEYNGKEYGFCCKGCDAKFKKDPAKYSKNLSEDGKKFIAKK